MESEEVDSKVDSDSLSATFSEVLSGMVVCASVISSVGFTVSFSVGACVLAAVVVVGLLVVLFCPHALIANADAIDKIIRLVFLMIVFPFIDVKVGDCHRYVVGARRM